MSVTDLTKGIYRRIYSGYRTGKRINSVSIQAEAWFWRLHAIADDFGNFPAEASLCRALAAPLRRTLRDADVHRWLCELRKANLTVHYEAAGETYGHVLGFLVLQPKAKNGKRVRRHPAWPGEQAEIAQGGIRVNPDQSAASEAEAEPEDQEHSHLEDGPPVVDRRARTAAAPKAGASLQKVSPEPSASDSQERTARLRARMHWLLESARLYAPAASPQGKADRTSAERLFDEYLWPDGADAAESAGHVERARALIPKAKRNGDTPMAWLTKRVYELVREEVRR